MSQDHKILFASTLKPYQRSVEEILKSHIENFGPDNALRSACEYALLNGGKRFRPALVLMVAKAIGSQADVSQAALGIEYFHTASLIADDLPCMDNDDERRSKPAVHRVYGEAVALLATYALISAGYDCLAKNALAIKNTSHPHAQESDRLCVLAIENVSRNTGVLGATGGQLLDLSPPDLTVPLLREVIYKKTVTLFEISFVLGWIYGGGDLARLDQVKKCAEYFGMAFQIADDIGDMQQDLNNNHPLNIANVCGREAAVQMFHEEIDQFEKTLSSLRVNLIDFQALSHYLKCEVKSC